MREKEKEKKMKKMEREREKEKMENKKGGGREEKYHGEIREKNTGDFHFWSQFSNVDR